MRDVAIAYKTAYDNLMNSYDVRVLFKLRRILGKGYQRLWNPIPQGCKGEPFRVDESNSEWIEALSDLVNGMPHVSSCSYYKRADLKIGIITDNFMFDYYKDAATFVE